MNQAVEVFRRKICAVFPGECVPFETELLKVLEVLQRGEHGASQNRAKIDYAISSIIEPEVNSMSSLVLGAGNVQYHL